MIHARSLAISIFCALLSAHLIHAQDLSTYRGFQLGMNLPAVAKQAGMATSEVKVVHARPALIQELNWQLPFSLSSSPPADPVWNTRFSFYDGELFRVVVNYDRYKTQGLTTEDMVEAISATYGTAAKPAGETTSLSLVYNDTQVVIARWEDSQYSIDLVRSSYQPVFGMIASSKRLDALARAASVEATRLDKQEAPQRESERQKKQDGEYHASQEKARLLNKPQFRP